MATATSPTVSLEAIDTWILSIALQHIEAPGYPKTFVGRLAFQNKISARVPADVRAVWTPELVTARIWTLFTAKDLSLAAQQSKLPKYLCEARARIATPAPIVPEPAPTAPQPAPSVTAAEHDYPALPFALQHALLPRVQEALEESCYEFAVQHALAPGCARPCAAAAELTTWMRELVAADGTGLDAAAAVTFKKLEVLRHAAVHRMPLAGSTLLVLLGSARAAAGLLGDARRKAWLRSVSNQLKKRMEELRAAKERVQQERAREVAEIQRMLDETVRRAQTKEAHEEQRIMALLAEDFAKEPAPPETRPDEMVLGGDAAPETATLAGATEMAVSDSESDRNPTGGTSPAETTAAPEDAAADDQSPPEAVATWSSEVARLLQRTVGSPLRPRNESGSGSGDGDWTTAVSTCTVDVEPTSARRAWDWAKRNSPTAEQDAEDGL